MIGKIFLKRFKVIDLTLYENFGHVNTLRLAYFPIFLQKDVQQDLMFVLKCNFLFFENILFKL